MRILHTSDWHLGRTLKGVDLSDAHRVVIDRIIDIVDEYGVDVVVVAGDIYDRAIPPTDAVRLLERALAGLCERVPVVVTPGNHDSAIRLGFGAALFTDRLHMQASLERAHEPVLLEDDHGPVAIYGVPFLDPEEVRQFARQSGDGDIPRTQAAAAEYVLRRIGDDRSRRQGVRSVVVAHAFVVDSPAASGEAAASPQAIASNDALSALGSESERDITAGGLDFVPTALFDGFSYAALGHLHGAQSRNQTASGAVVAYSGSPLRFSFSESAHRKGVTLVDLDAAGEVMTSRIDLPQPRGMAQLQGTMAQLLAAGEDPPRGPHAAHVDDWVDITVTDDRRPDEMRARLLNAFPHMLSHRHRPLGEARSAEGLGAAVATAASPLDVMTAFVSEVADGEILPEEKDVLRAVADEVFGEGR